MVVAIVRGGVFGSACLVGDRCRVGARLPCPAPVPGISCGRRGPVGLGSAGRVDLWCRRALILTARGDTGWGG
jgi:hypothetical protein